jgi:replicative DNA helicase
MSADALPLPANLEAERAVLGAILVDNSLLDVAQQARVGPESFFRDAHQRLYRALVTLAERRSALDMVTVVDELRRAGDLDEVGGPAYVASLIDGMPHSANIAHYVALVLDCASRRALMHVARIALTEAASGDEQAPALVDRTLSRLLEVGQRTDVGQLVEAEQTVGDVVAYLDELGRRRADRRAAGVPTGFAALDDLLDGFQPGQLIIVAGKTSEGKTALALQFAIASGSCAFFSCEMERMELAVRQLAVHGRVDGWALRRDFLSSF